MTSKIILKKSSVASKVPVVGDLEFGELALNYTDGKLWYKTATNTIAQLNAGGSTFTGGTVSGATFITDSTSSTTSGTGALKVTGGVGIVENLNVGGLINKLTITPPTTSATLTIFDGKTISFPQSLAFPSTTGTTSSTLTTNGSGALSWVDQTISSIFKPIDFNTPHGMHWWPGPSNGSATPSSIPLYYTSIAYNIATAGTTTYPGTHPSNTFTSAASTFTLAGLSDVTTSLNYKRGNTVNGGFVFQSTSSFPSGSGTTMFTGLTDSNGVWFGSTITAPIICVGIGWFAADNPLNVFRVIVGNGTTVTTSTITRYSGATRLSPFYKVYISCPPGSTTARLDVIDYGLTGIPEGYKILENYTLDLSSIAAGTGMFPGTAIGTVSTTAATTATVYGLSCITSPDADTFRESTVNITGNAATATKLANSVTINGTAFDGSANITVSGGGGSPGGADKQVQFNNAGVFAGSSGLTYNVTTNLTSLGGTDPGLNITGITEEHNTPEAGTLIIYAKSIAGRMLPKWIGPSGFDTPFQAIIAQNKIAWWNPPGNANTVPGIIGMSAVTAIGTATARNVAATNIFTRAKRLGYNSAATAGAAGGHFSPAAGIQYTIGTGTGLGGFYYVCRFGSADTQANAISFVGLSSTAVTPVVTASPATFTNAIGIGCATADTNYSIYYGGSAAQTPIALGVGFPAKTNSTDLIELILFAASNVNNAVGWRVTNLSKSASFTAAISGTTLTTSLVTKGTVGIGQTILGGAIAANTKITAGSGTSWTVSVSQTVSATLVEATMVETGTLTAATPGTQLPASTTFMGHRAYRSNNATAGAVLIDVVSIYIEVDT